MSGVDTNLPETANPPPARPSLTSLAFWLLLGKVISFALSVVLPLLLVRKLSKEEFGLYKQAFLVVGTAIQMLPLGIAMSAYYFLPREPKLRGQVMFNVLLCHAFATGLAFIALLLSPSLLHLIFNSSELEPYAPLIGLVILLWGVSYFLETAVVANQESQLAATLIIVAQFSKTIFMVTAAVVFTSVKGLLYAAIFQGIAQTILLIGYLERRFPGFWRHFDQRSAADGSCPTPFRSVWRARYIRSKTTITIILFRTALVLSTLLFTRSAAWTFRWSRFWARP